jgi:5-methylcytosine-specific restriction endonuclease McrA
MIKLQKLEQPQILREKAYEWTKQYLESADKPPDSVRYRYRHEQIKNQLVAETNGKCCYCESKMRHVDPGHIDHILPVSKRRELICCWRNLTLACPNCNTNKNAYYDEADPLLNPYLDKLEDHLMFCGPLVAAHPYSNKGLLTVESLKLNRLELVETRIGRIEQVQSTLRSFVNEKSKSVRRYYRKALRAQIEATSEYSATLRAFVVAEIRLIRKKRHDTRSLSVDVTRPA